MSFLFGSGGSPGGKNAGLLLPPGQAGAADAYRQMTQPLFDQGISAFNQMQGVSPAQQAWPNVYESTQNILRNPYLGDAVSGGVFARDIFQNQMYPQAMQAGGTLSNLGNLMAGQAGGIPGMMNNPAYAQAGQLGQQFSPQYANAVNQLSGAAGNILNTGFDPRQELYNRTAQQIRDQQNAINTQSGVASSPYGAGLSGQRMQDFNIDWQNQQLQRQGLAGQAAGQLYGQAGTMGNQAMQSLMMGPNAQLAAQQAGTGILGDLTRGAGAGLTGAQGLYGGLAQAAPGMMGASYNAFNQPQAANMAALQNMIGLGNAMYQPGQQAASNLSNYMGLGQRASEIANQIGQTNFNQAMGLGSGITQGLGALGGSNLLFGNQGLSGALGLGQSGLFGSLFGGGAGAGSLADIAAFGGAPAFDAGGALLGGDFGSLLAGAALL